MRSSSAAEIEKPTALSRRVGARNDTKGQPCMGVMITLLLKMITLFFLNAIFENDTLFWKTITLNILENDNTIMTLYTIFNWIVHQKITTKYKIRYGKLENTLFILANTASATRNKRQSANVQLSVINCNIGHTLKRPANNHNVYHLIGEWLAMGKISAMIDFLILTDAQLNRLS